MRKKFFLYNIITYLFFCVNSFAGICEMKWGLLFPIHFIQQIFFYKAYT